jgi:hypothetical protein
MTRQRWQLGSTALRILIAHGCHRTLSERDRASRLGPTFVDAKDGVAPVLVERGSAPKTARVRHAAHQRTCLSRIRCVCEVTRAMRYDKSRASASGHFHALLRLLHSVARCRDR